MQKTITARSQLQLKPFFKKILRPVTTLVLTALEVLEKVDEQFFLPSDTWQMRVMFYSFYFVAIPAFIVFGLKYLI